MALALIRMWHANYAVRTLLTLHTVICKVALAKCHKSHPCSFLLLAEPHLPTDPISPPVFAFPWGNRQGVTRRRTRRDTDERVGGVDEEEEDEGGGGRKMWKDARAHEACECLMSVSGYLGSCYSSGWLRGAHRSNSLPISVTPTGSALTKSSTRSVQHHSASSASGFIPQQQEYLIYPPIISRKIQMHIHIFHFNLK